MMPGNLPKSSAVLEIANIGYKGTFIWFPLGFAVSSSNAEMVPKITSYYFMFLSSLYDLNL